MAHAYGQRDDVVWSFLDNTLGCKGGCLVSGDRTRSALGQYALIMRHWARHVSFKRFLYVANVKLLFV